MSKAEVAIVGGGPAGALCALILAREGVGVRLMHWDGYAPSGVELISGHARRMVKQHCPGLLVRIPGLEIQETVSLWGTQEPVTFNAMFNPWGPGIAMERSLLDLALRDQAAGSGASVMSDAKVMNIERGKGNWRLLLRRGEAEGDLVSARLLVIATGRAATGLINRLPTAEQSQIALMALLPSPFIQGRRPGHTLYLEAAENGWWYALPVLNQGHFAGFCIRRHDLKKRRTSLREFFIQELHRTQLLAPLFKSMPVDFQITGRIAGVFPFVGAVGEGWIAVGDAAFAPDPLSGLGLEWAVESAQLGAEAILQAVRGCGLDKFAQYEDLIRARASRHEQAAKHYYSGGMKGENRVEGSVFPESAIIQCDGGTSQE